MSPLISADSAQQPCDRIVRVFVIVHVFLYDIYIYIYVCMWIYHIYIYVFISLYFVSFRCCCWFVSDWSYQNMVYFLLCRHQLVHDNISNEHTCTIYYLSAPRETHHRIVSQDETLRCSPQSPLMVAIVVFFSHGFCRPKLAHHMRAPASRF